MINKVNVCIIKEEAIDEDLISISEKISEDSNSKKDNKKKLSKEEKKCQEEKELEDIIFFDKGNGNFAAVNEIFARL